ncbi:protein hunchback isoform X2 [Diachasmimorpha longicaudata]|uniref:protein hunchback isoform X2 n=1 Tax=Diachasmimorpha longicaudata TaxID=58733 RepID=UPI0030B8FF88
MREKWESGEDHGLPEEGSEDPPSGMENNEASPDPAAPTTWTLTDKLAQLSTSDQNTDSGVSPGHYLSESPGSSASPFNTSHSLSPPSGESNDSAPLPTNNYQFGRLEFPIIPDGETDEGATAMDQAMDVGAAPDVSHPPEETPESLQCPVCHFTAENRVQFRDHLTAHCMSTESPDLQHALFAQLSPSLKPQLSPQDAEEREDAALRQPRINCQGKVKTFRCRQCNFSAVTKLDFWEHSRLHIRMEKLLTCPRCPFVTEFKHHLEYHIRNHFNSKPFKCDKCPYSCVNKSMLNSHLKSHSSVYQYRCANCAYATKYCHSLKLHLRKYNHQAAIVLNPDGTPNPLPIIDVYGTRRGPKRKPSQLKSAANSGSRLRSPPQPGPSAMGSPQPGPSGMQSPQPGTSQINFFPSGTSQINFSQPGTSQMNFSQPGTSQMNFSQPGTSQMNFSQPGTSQMNFSQPGTSQMNFSQPGTSQMNFSQPGTSQMAQLQPETSWMGLPQPGTSQMGSPQPGTSQMGMPQMAPIAINSGFNSIMAFSTLNPMFSTFPVVNGFTGGDASRMEEVRTALYNEYTRTIAVADRMNADIPHESMIYGFSDNPSYAAEVKEFETMLMEQGDQDENEEEENDREESCAAPLDLSKPDTSNNSNSNGSNEAAEQTPDPPMKSNGKSRRKGKAVKLTRQVVQQEDEPEVVPQVVEEIKQEQQEPEANNTPEHSPQEFICQYCELSFGNDVMYTVHMGYHGFTNPFTCNMCGHRCVDKVSFFLHIARVKHS